MMGCPLGSGWWTTGNDAMTVRIQTYGATPVPYTVAWTAESRMWIGPCKWAGLMPALMQASAPGVGRPIFGTPHNVRQREAVSRGLCDLCGRTLKGRTMVSLSQEDARGVPTLGYVMLAVEPMAHRECAAISLQHCPELKRQIANGTLRIRQVFSFSIVAQLLNEAATLQFAGVRAQGAVGHLKQYIRKWQDREPDWLTHYEKSK